MNNDLPHNLPTGTQILINAPVLNEVGKVAHPQGAVGVIIKVLDNDTYRIRFLDSFETVLSRNEIMTRKHFQRKGLQAQPDVVDYYQYIIFQCVTGSRAYGLDHDASDTDRRGIYLPPADLHWSLYGLPEQIENHETEECYWELQKFISLALKANPNILECLYTPLIEKTTPLSEALIEQREIFLSKLIYQTYNGYVMSQFRKMNKHMEKHGRIKWKHAMHLIRLLISGITVLQEGFVPVKVGTYREDLLAIRHGERSWEEVNQWRLSLNKEFEEAFKNTKLPEQPNYEAANQFLIKARREMVDNM